jgi:hypothetical protein
MPVDYGVVEANRIKHLEMIQAVVTRLAGNSFLVRGWALTVSAAFFGFAITQDDSRLALVGLLPVTLFFALDAYFLQAERLFRLLYDEVRDVGSDIEPFLLNATSDEFRKKMTAAGKDVSWQAATWRPMLLLFYGGLTAIGIAVALATN